MAIKGQRFRVYSGELKEEILKKYLSGVSASVLAEQYGVPRGTIKTWKRGLERGMAGSSRGRPRSKGLTAEDYKERYEILKNTRPSYKHDEGKGDVHSHSYKRIQTVQPMRGFGGIPQDLLQVSQ